MLRTISLTEKDVTEKDVTEKDVTEKDVTERDVPFWELYRIILWLFLCISQAIDHIHYLVSVLSEYRSTVTCRGKTRDY